MKLVSAWQIAMLIVQKRIAIALWMVGSGLLWAHPTLDSKVALNFQRDTVHAVLQMPLDDLLVAEPGLKEPGDGTIELDDIRLRNYMLAHFKVVPSGGVTWESVIKEWRVANPTSMELPAMVHATLVLMPDRKPINQLTLNVDLISHEVRNHSILVVLQSDWEAGIAAQAPQSLGTLGHDRTQITVTRNRPQPFAAWLSFVSLGAEHILSGLDHLLFLALVLIAASLQQQSKAWGEAKRPVAAARSALGIVTAFTLGHSATLGLGALGVVNFSAFWVEALVAVSIVLSAVHLLRPIFAGQETWVAGGFGLVHGLAFAQSLEILHLSVKDRIVSLFGFNLGIELMQMVLAVAFLPLLLWCLRNPFQSELRRASGCLGLIAGMVWLVQRTSCTIFQETRLWDYAPCFWLP